jgi:uncharacterized protein (DUF1684 family)
LSLINKVPIGPGEHRVGSADDADIQLPKERAPAQLGSFVLHDGRVRFIPDASVLPNASVPQDASAMPLGVRRARSQITEAVHSEIALESDAHGEPDRLLFGSLRLEIMQQTDSFAVRVRDTESATRRDFVGLDYYPIRPEWRVSARLVPYQPERQIELLYETGSTARYRSPGAAVFRWQGVEYRLDPVLESQDTRLFVLFGDLTNRTTSYGAGRFLYCALPKDGEVILDFNQAFSPPCAFSAYTACPLPPPQNRLALHVEAGEKRPRSPK